MICFIRESKLNIEGVVLYKDFFRYGRNTRFWQFQLSRKEKNDLWKQAAHWKSWYVLYYKDFLRYGRSMKFQKLKFQVGTKLLVMSSSRAMKVSSLAEAL